MAIWRFHPIDPGVCVWASYLAPLIGTATMRHWWPSLGIVLDLIGSAIGAQKRAPARPKKGLQRGWAKQAWETPGDAMRYSSTRLTVSTATFSS